MKLRHPLLIRVAAHIVAGAMRLWFKASRLETVGEVTGINPFADSGDERFLYCIWHDAIFGMIFSRKHERMAGLVSRHADGSYVADIMSIFHVRPIRGSSGRGGAVAVREMMAAAQDWHIAIAADGPRGPRHELKDGIIYLASQTGRGIIPTAYVARKAWRPRGKWTDMLIPRLGTRTWIVGAKPFHVPPGLKPSELGPYREALAAEMARVHAIADQIARGERDQFDPLPEMQEPLVNQPRRAA
ncbi:MAG: DUF374 domain-containing protein [Planctomycetaceae bacterium]